MMHELIGENPAADDCEQMGRFLRHAFPLGLGSFAELPYALKGEETSGNSAREEATLRAKKASIDSD